MKPNIGIASKNLKGVTDILSNVLANQVALYTKTRKFHWNVSGESFMELHELFEAQYKILEKQIDEVAERINKLGSNTIGTMQEFLERTTLKENPDKYPASRDMLTELLGDHETVIVEMRGYIKECDETFDDAGTTDFITGLMKEHETIAWKLRRYLK